jgi:hypothetical protein
VVAAQFKARIKELIENFPDLAVLVEPLLVVRRWLASSSASRTAACWPSCGTTTCVGA